MFVEMLRTYRNLQQAHVNQLRTDLDCLVEHLAHKVSHIGTLRVGCLDKNFEQVKGVPSMPLNVGSKRLDSRTGPRDVFYGNDLTTRKIDEAECVSRQRKQGIKEA